jgi:hypothetical protein
MNIEEIIKSYGRFIKSEIYFYDQDAFVVDEVYQKVIIKLWQKSPETINYAFLSKLVKNTFIDNYRRNKKHLNHIPIEWGGLVSDYNATDYVSKKENKIESDLFMEEFIKQLGKLKESQREVILLRLAGYNFIEIGKILNITQNKAIGQMYYAKKNLTKLIIK